MSGSRRVRSDFLNLPVYTKKFTPSNLHDICEHYNYHPFEALLKLTMETTETGIKIQGLKELCQYIYPKRKAIEMSGDINMDLAREAQEISKLPESDQIELMRQEVASWDARHRIPGR